MEFHSFCFSFGLYSWAIQFIFVYLFVCLFVYLFVLSFELLIAVQLYLFVFLLNCANSVFVCSLTASLYRLSAYSTAVVYRDLRNWRGSEWSWVRIYVKVSRNLSCETLSVMQPFWPIDSLLIKVPKPLICCADLRVESFYVILVG